MILEPTKNRVEQHLESFVNQVKKSPKRGADLANELLDHCRPMMDLFDLFHGEEAHQRNDLFDKVAETVLQMVVSHQRATKDNKSFVDLLRKSLALASGVHIRERIIENISIGEGNLQHQVKQERLNSFFKILKYIQETPASPQVKYAQILDKIIPKLPEVSSELGANSELSGNLFDSVAIMLREISVDAHNSNQDFDTAMNAIKLAQKLVRNDDLKVRILSDTSQLVQNRAARSMVSMPTMPQPTRSSSGCLFLLLIPSFVGASAIHFLIDLLT
jgi:hypothetical protein